MSAHGVPQLAAKPVSATALAPGETLLQRKCACGNAAPGLIGECEACRGKTRPRLFGKLAVSEPDAPLEREADRIAAHVMRKPHPWPDPPERQDGTGAFAAGEPFSFAALGSEPRSNASAPQMNAATATHRHSSAQSSDHTSLARAGLERLRAQGGERLDPETLAFMEPRFRHNFSHVRIHTSGLASDAARAANALAFTIGHDIVFRGGEYRPRTYDGRRLLAHELAHVIQQDASPTTDRQVLRAACPDECLECPPDGVVREGCECLGDEKPRLVVSAPAPVRIVRLHGASSEGAIRRGIRQADKTWRAAGIEIDASIHSIDRADTEKILGTDDRGRLRENVQIEPESAAINADSTRALLGLPTESGNEKLSIPAGKSPHNVVVYYVPEFNACAGEKKAIGCAFSNTYGGRYFVVIEKHHQDVALAHELGHIWGNQHIEDKRNVMHPQASKTGLSADQIRAARRMLGLGKLRCLPEGASATDRERIEEEQQMGQLLLLLIEGEWSGAVTVNGTPRDSSIQFRVDHADNTIHGAYWYETAAGKQPGRILNGVTTGDRVDYDWEQGSGAEAAKGKGSFTLSSIHPPFRLAGRWGTGDSRSNGGDWSVTWDHALSGPTKR